jgi:hypothetical protein
LASQRRLLLNENNNVQLVIHAQNAKTGQTHKMLETYYPKIRRNMGIYILSNQLLITHIYVSEMETTYASGKVTHVVGYYIYT